MAMLRLKSWSASNYAVVETQAVETTGHKAIPVTRIFLWRVSLDCLRSTNGIQSLKRKGNGTS
jgi:hypothetical protein